MSLQLSKEEVLYQRKNFYETLRVHGLPCAIYSIADDHADAYDFYSDIVDENSSFDNSIESLITYEEVPQIKTLKSLGWYVDSEELPIIGHIPVIYKDKKGNIATFSPNIDDRIVIYSNPHDANASERVLLLKDFKGQGFPSVIYYICKLVPYRKD